MKNLLHFPKIAILAVLSFLVLACDQNNEEMPATEEMNIVQTAQNTDVLSSLVSALLKADEKEGSNLVGTLSGEGPFTVFAPTNDAFAALLASLDGYDSLEDFDTDEEKSLLATILSYHVIAGVAAKSTDLSGGQKLGTVQGEELTIKLENGVFIQDATENDAEVVLANVETSNGVVHVIDKVLVPQAVIDALNTAVEMQNIVEIAVATDDLSLLVGALQQANAGLVETLSSEGPFTVFAPTNAAFSTLLDVLGDDYNSLADFDTDEEKALLVKVLTYHVVAGAAALSTDLSNGQMIETFQGEKVGIKIMDGMVHIEDATDTNAIVVLADVEASNGVVHVIDKVLLPQEVLDILNPPLPNIVALAQSVEDLSSLVAALIQADAGLVEVLGGEGPFTVFAPTNKAFEDLLALIPNCGSLADFDTEEEKALLVKILTYHVVAGAAVASSSLTDHQEIVTVQGESLFALLGDGVAIRDKTHNDANVILADQMASNGVVHVVDKVLLPQEVLDLLGH